MTTLNNTNNKSIKGGIDMDTYDTTKAYADSVWANFGDIVKDDIKCEIIEDVITMTYDNSYEHPAWKKARRTGSIYNKHIRK